MKVKQESPVSKEEQPYLHSWDQTARRYFGFYERNIIDGRQGLLNVLTRGHSDKDVHSNQRYIIDLEN